MAEGKLMSRSKSKDKPESVEDVWEKAFGDMCSGLDKFGRYEILNLLVANSHRDRVVNELLATYPGVVATGKFLSNFRTVKVTKRLFKKLQRQHCIL
jgi:hypothetical protein